MLNKVYGYARVSTKEQHLDRQIIALKKYGVDERDIVTDKESVKDLDRKGYALLKEQLLRPGDTLVIQDLDRLSRDKTHINQELQYFQSQKIRVKILNIPTTLIDPPKGQEWVIEMTNNIIIEVYASIAENERKRIRERQREGIEAARINGRHLGRPKISYPAEWGFIYQEWKEGKITAVHAMNTLGLKRGTFYRLVRQWSEIDNR